VKGRCLVTGGSGFIGAHLARALRNAFDVTVTYHTRQPAPPSTVRGVHLDVTDAAEVESVVHGLSPDIVVHAAGWKNINDCEKNPDMTWKVNAEGTRQIAEACGAEDVRVLYLSTDYVFAGTQGGYSEADETRPATVYGRSKLAGEKAVAGLAPNYAICRASGVYGPNANFTTWLRGELANGRTVEVFTDAANSPTYIGNLAEMIRTVLERKLQGVFHTAGSERSTRYEFARQVAEAFGFDTALIRPTTRAAQKQRTVLAADCSLSVAASQRAIGIPFLDVATGLAQWKLDCAESFSHDSA